MSETVRQKIIAALEEGECTAKEISGLIGIAEREVYEHLEHIRKTVQHKNAHFVIIPARCLHCDYVFSKRDKLKKPSKCPACRGTFIEEPLYRIAGKI